MAHTTVSGAETHSLVPELLAVVRSPEHDYPILIQRHRVGEVLFFPAVSGVYVAYAAAERLHLGDSLGFWATFLGVLGVGAGLGLLALAFTVTVLSVSSRAAGGTANQDELSGVFGYATWPFVPLLMVLVPLELWAYGGAIFSANRPPTSALIPIVTTGLETLAILLWLYLMVRGTAVEAHLSNGVAARTLGLAFARGAMILVLLLIIAFVSFMI
jgi:hypothetical protein